MTNREIVFDRAQHLAEAGIIKYTGRVYNVKFEDGHEIRVKETEAIHTYQAWKELGFQVQKGQKAVDKFTIWKHVTRKNTETGEEIGKMILKTAAFFSQSQVEAIA